jgi:hypothetical protein
MMSRQQLPVPALEVLKTVDNSLTNIGDAVAQITETGLLPAWLAERNHGVELNVHLHLRVRRHEYLSRPGSRDEAEFRVVTGDLCAVFEGGSWIRVGDPGDGDREGGSNLDPRLIGQAPANPVDPSVPIGIAEFPKHQQRWESCGGLIRLQGADECDVARIDKVQAGLPRRRFQRRLNDLPLPLVFRADDRELVSRVDFMSGLDHKFGYETVEGTPDVVENLAQFDSPTDLRDRRLFFENNGMRLVRRVVIVQNRGGLSVGFVKVKNLFVESVEVHFGSIEKRSDPEMVNHIIGGDRTIAFGDEYLSLPHQIDIDRSQDARWASPIALRSNRPLNNEIEALAPATSDHDPARAPLESAHDSLIAAKTPLDSNNAVDLSLRIIDVTSPGNIRFPSQDRRSRRLPRRTLGAATLRVVLASLLAVAGAICLVFASTSRSGPPLVVRSQGVPPKVAVTHGTLPSPATPELKPHALVLQRSTPVLLSIPAINLRLGLTRLGLNADGTVQVPKNFQMPGWFNLGAAPGQLGSAVILGHVDSVSGPAAFYNLDKLHQGDAIDVGLANGIVTHFQVRSIATYPKSTFPAQLVYGELGKSTLRLVTCAGQFDYATHHYLSNLVIFASLASATIPA